MRMTRLVKHACVLATAGVFAAVASTASAGPLDGQKLTVATWGGPWLKYHQEAIQPQLEALGATVEYVLSSPQDNLAKLIASRGRAAPFDTMEVLDAQWHLM
jgi:ABC-type glycerol-3-phosphate transport system substrate-binding protein